MGAFGGLHAARQKATERCKDYQSVANPFIGVTGSRSSVLSSKSLDVPGAITQEAAQSQGGSFYARYAKVTGLDDSPSEFRLERYRIGAFGSRIVPVHCLRITMMRVGGTICTAATHVSRPAV